jgi:hypothetical protein
MTDARPRRASGACAHRAISSSGTPRSAAARRNCSAASKPKRRRLGGGRLSPANSADRRRPLGQHVQRLPSLVASRTAGGRRARRPCRRGAAEAAVPLRLPWASATSSDSTTAPAPLRNEHDGGASAAACAPARRRRPPARQADVAATPSRYGPAPAAAWSPAATAAVMRRGVRVPSRNCRSRSRRAGCRRRGPLHMSGRRCRSAARLPQPRCRRCRGCRAAARTQRVRVANRTPGSIGGDDRPCPLSSARARPWRARSWR